MYRIAYIKQGRFTVFNAGSGYGIGCYIAPYKCIMELAHIVGKSADITRENAAIFKFLSENVGCITTDDGKTITLDGNARHALLTAVEIS